MSIDFTTTALIANVKRRCGASAGSGLTSADFLAYATAELRSYITSFLKGIREEFIIATVDVSAATSPIAAPVRAVGAASRTVGWLKSDGNVRFLPRIEPENAGGFASQTGEPQGFMLQGNDIYILPAQTSGTIRIAYQQRPGELVLPSACALITTVTVIPGSSFIDVSAAIPSTFNVSSALTPFDAVSGSPNFVAYALDIDSVPELYWVTTTRATVSDALVALMSVGDYVCLAGETCIPQVPIEVVDLLAQATAAKIAQSVGSDRYQAIKQGLTDLEAQMRLLLSPRADGNTRPIISRSRIGRFNYGW